MTETFPAFATCVSEELHVLDIILYCDHLMEYNIVMLCILTIVTLRILIVKLCILLLLQLFLLLHMFRSGYYVSLCCSVYCLCVNVYYTTVTGCQPNCK